MKQHTTSLRRAMAFEFSAFNVINRFKPHILMILLQIFVASVYFLTEDSFNQGLNPHIYVTYRHAAGSLMMFPFAYFLERCLIHIFTHTRHQYSVVVALIILTNL